MLFDFFESKPLVVRQLSHTYRERKFYSEIFFFAVEICATSVRNKTVLPDAQRFDKNVSEINVNKNVPRTCHVGRVGEGKMYPSQREREKERERE